MVVKMFVFVLLRINKLLSATITTFIYFSFFTPALADTFTQSYLAAGVQNIDTAALCSGTTNCVVGTETFNSLQIGSYAGKTAIYTDFGANGVFTGQISGSFSINNADRYGGAGNTGKYAVTFGTTGYSVAIFNTAAVVGANYFSLDITALDAGNYVDFYSGNTLVKSYAPSDLISAVGSCPGSAYCGNPNTGQNKGEQYALVNFYDNTGTFDRVFFHESAGYGGGYEVDNFTVGYVNPNTGVQGTTVKSSTPVSGAAPAPLPLLGSSPFAALLLTAGMFVRRRLAV